MGRVLLAYYSLTGNTRKLALAIAPLLAPHEVDVVEIRATAESGGVSRGLTWAVVSALRKKPVEVAPTGTRMADYDVLVVGGPVWLLGASSPVAAFLRREAVSAKALAFFCTEFIAGTRVFGQMQAASWEKDPVATLAVSATDRTGLRRRMRDFTDAIKRCAN